MTIQHTEAKIMKELRLKGVINVSDMDNLNIAAIQRLETLELVGRYSDKIILTDMGLKVAGYLRGAN